MGFFKNMRATVDTAREMQANAEAMVAEANQPVDLNDPVWAPIEGIDLDRYAQITAALARQSLAGVEQVEAWVESQGVHPGTWSAVNQGWTQRMAGNMQVRNRYGVLYSQFTG